MRNLLREKRMELYPNISMKEFCNKIGIKKGSYWNWENGLSTSYAEHNAWTARRVCEALGISDAELKEALSNNYKAAKDGTMEKSGVYICAPNKKSGAHNVLVDWRINNRLTTKDAADILDVSQRVYCLWENGKGRPSGDNLKKLLELTGLSMHQIASIYNDAHKEEPKPTYSYVKKPEAPKSTYSYGEKIGEIKLDENGCPYTEFEIDDNDIKPDPDEPEVIASPITPEEFAALNNKEVHEKMDEVITERDENGKPVAGRYPWQMTEEEAEALNEPHDFRDEVIDEVLEKMYGQMDYKKYVYLVGLLGR